MKLLETETKPDSRKVAIPVERITGINECDWNGYTCFVATGPEGEDTTNGYYLTESYESVKAKLEAL